MHNMSHALCAYLGYQRNYEYIYQAVNDYDIKYVALNALCQSALAVAKENGVELESLISHAQNLLYRFTNVALADTVARVGKDTIRKLGSNDRLIGAINLADKHNVSCEYLCLGVALGMRFAPEGDESSQEVCAFAKENGAKKNDGRHPSQIFPALDFRFPKKQTKTWYFIIGQSDDQRRRVFSFGRKERGKEKHTNGKHIKK